MAKNVLEVSILGSNFTIKSDSDPGYLQEIIDYLKSKVEEARQGCSLSDPLKVALLASLNLVDELFRAREQPNKEIEDITRKLIERIDRSLSQIER